MLKELISWMSTVFKQTTMSYCDIQTADSNTVLVGNDGSLVSVIKVSGVKSLIGKEEFDHVLSSMQESLQTTMSQPGHTMQVFFIHSKDEIKNEIGGILSHARDTARVLRLDFKDLFAERVNNLAGYCAHEECYFVLWTKLGVLTKDQLKKSSKNKLKESKQNKIPAFLLTQNIMATVTEIRESHDAFVGSLCSDFSVYGMVGDLLNIHDAVHAMRNIADPEFTDRSWRASLPGDKLVAKEYKNAKGDIADLTWPALAKQILPRDSEILDMRTARVGDRIYSSVFIELFPTEVQSFMRFFGRIIQSHIPWRMSFLIDSNGLGYSKVRASLASILSFTSPQNRLIADSLNLLSYIDLNTDDSVVRFRVTATTWAREGETRLLRSRVSILAKAIESWGSCDVSEFCGDAYEGVVSSMMGVSSKSVASASIAPLSNVLRMLPLFRPSSPWENGAVLFRSPDGKPWPYHPGSRQQTTWIDIFYARPGSGKSVLSNAINLAVCLSPGIIRLPRIAIIDIGPSSSGLISLLKEALPVDKKHLVAHHRLRMKPEYSINPFDTQLGSRYPSPQERSFLVNFLSLLATPIGSDQAYDGVSDMSGIIIDELYKQYIDSGNPNTYTAGLEDSVDLILDEVGAILDQKTSWWEVTDTLFLAGFEQEAVIAQRHAMPVLADVAAICRLPAIEDLYGKIVAPTGEPLIHAFSRMMSGAVREYPIISQPTKFDLGDARVVALDLDEVARSGGDAANRQTAVMYMLARYVLGKSYYLTEENLLDMPESYRNYHKSRISEIKEDPKRIVYDEFHRTSNAKAVRDQVIIDMREGRKWKVQVALLSQSLDDFDKVMVEFATSIFIMEAGPEQAVARTAQVFGLSDTARYALKTRVHGPREEGSTFLAQFATKGGVNTQLLTSTLGPIELWALNTTADDVQVRTKLYNKLGAKVARKLLAKHFPSGTATKHIESMLSEVRSDGGLIDDDIQASISDKIVDEMVRDYHS